LDKVKKLLSFINEKRPTKVIATIETAHKIKQEPGEEADIAPETKQMKVEQVNELNHSSISGEVWTTCTGTRIKLYADDKLFVEGNHRLNDNHINFVQAILRVQFPQYDGLQTTLLQGQRKYTITSQMVQILHIRHDYLVVISNLQSKENELKLYDTVYDDEEITITMDIAEAGRRYRLWCILHRHRHILAPWPYSW